MLKDLSGPDHRSRQPRRSFVMCATRFTEPPILNARFEDRWRGTQLECGYQATLRVAWASVSTYLPRELGWCGKWDSSSTWPIFWDQEGSLGSKPLFRNDFTFRPRPLALCFARCTAACCSRRTRLGMSRPMARAAWVGLEETVRRWPLNIRWDQSEVRDIADFFWRVSPQAVRGSWTPTSWSVWWPPSSGYRSC